MKTIYKGDDRYEKVKEQMDLLSITDVTTERQVLNGTIVWRMPFKARGNYIEYGAFTTGYVRNQGNQCHSNWQCNKRVEGEPQYFKLPNGDYRKYVGKVCKMIPIEIDRLEYMMKYVIKNEFIKRAKLLETDFVPKWQYDNLRETIIDHGVDMHVQDLENELDIAKNKLEAIKNINI